MKKLLLVLIVVFTICLVCSSVQAFETQFEKYNRQYVILVIDIYPEGSSTSIVYIYDILYCSNGTVLFCKELKTNKLMGILTSDILSIELLEE